MRTIIDTIEVTNIGLRATGYAHEHNITTVLFKNAQTGGVWAWGRGTYVLCFMLE